MTDMRTGKLYDRLSMEIKPELNHWLAALAAMIEDGGNLGGSAYMQDYAAESVYALVRRVADFVDDVEAVLRGGEA